MTIPAFTKNPNLRPMANRILVKRLDRETKTAGGLILPETAAKLNRTGTVLVVGAGSRDEDGELIPLDVKVGDTVMFGQYAGLDLKIDGEWHLLLREDEVLGIVDSE